MWPPDLSTIGDQLDERDEAEAPIAYEWFGGDHMPALGFFSVGTRQGIASALLTIPGVRMVGIADRSVDDRIEPYTVAILIRFDPFSMTNGPMAAADRDLLEAEVANELYNSMPAGIASTVAYEEVTT